MSAKSAPSVLRFEDIHISLAPGHRTGGVREVLRGLSLELRRAESVALLGASGGGKSLLCRAATAFFRGIPVREIRGAVRFGDENLLAMGQGRLAGLRGARIGHLLQDAHAHFHPRLTIGEHFSLLLRHRKRGVTDRVEHARGYLYRVGVVDPDELLLEEVFPGELDVMMRQKVMIAAVLACEPEVLVADEPTAELDSQSVVRLADTLEALKRERGLSILFATGRVRRAGQFGDRVAVLDEGVIAECAPPRELFGSANAPATGAFLDATLVAGREKERLLAHRAFGGGA